VRRRSFDRDEYFRLVELAQQRHDEATVCAEVGARVAACVLAAAALEAVLLVSAANHELELREQRAWPKKDPLTWDLLFLVNLAAEEKWWGEAAPRFEKVANAVRLVRNWIHPGAFVRQVPGDAPGVAAEAWEQAYTTLEALWDARWATMNIAYPGDLERLSALEAHP
jgi:hypothetical protein